MLLASSDKCAVGISGEHRVHATQLIVCALLIMLVFSSLAVTHTLRVFSLANVIVIAQSEFPKRVFLPTLGMPLLVPTLLVSTE
jgi:hypothetical protein